MYGVHLIKDVHVLHSSSCNFRLRQCILSFFLNIAHFFSLTQTRQPELLFHICMDLQRYVRSYSVRKWLLGSFQSLSWMYGLSVHPTILPHPPHALSASRTNERLATAFRLIVISLSQGELSRDRASSEQFSSPPIRRAAVLKAEWMEKNRQASRHTGRQTLSRERESQILMVYSNSSFFLLIKVT